MPFLVEQCASGIQATGPLLRDLILKYFHFIPKLKILLFYVMKQQKRCVVSCACFTCPCSFVDSCKLDLWLSNLKL